MKMECWKHCVILTKAVLFVTEQLETSVEQNLRIFACSSTVQFGAEPKYGASKCSDYSLPWDHPSPSV